MRSPLWPGPSYYPSSPVSYLRDPRPPPWIRCCRHTGNRVTCRSLDASCSNVSLSESPPWFHSLRGLRRYGFWHYFCLQDMVALSDLDHVYIPLGSVCQTFAWKDYTRRETKMASHILSFMCSFPYSLSKILLRDTLFQCQCQILGFQKCVQATYPLGQWVFYIFGSKTVVFLYSEHLM